MNTCTRKLARGGRIPFLHGACVCIWSLYANGAAPVGRCTGRVMGTRFAAHTPREHEHGVCSGRGSKMRLKTNLLLRVSSVLSDRVTVALQGFASHAAAVRRRRFAPRIQHRRSGAFYRRAGFEIKNLCVQRTPPTFAAAALPQIQRRRIAAQIGRAVSRTTSRLRKTWRTTHTAALCTCSARLPQ